MTYSLLLRQTKGSKLSITEMDDNLLYLEQLASTAGTQGHQGPQGPRGFDGANGSQGPQGVNGTIGDKYYATSSIFMSVPDIGYVVNMPIQPNLSFTINQSVIVYNDLGSFYVDENYDDGDIASGLFYGVINHYDKISGTISIVTDKSVGVGLTYSYWVVNLSGGVGPQGATGNGSGSSIGASGPQGSIQFNNDNSFSGSPNLYWDGHALNIYSGTSSDILRLGADTGQAYVYINSDGSNGNIGVWNDGDSTLHMSGSITKGTPATNNNSTEIATTEFVNNFSSTKSNLFTFTMSSNDSLLSNNSIIKNISDGITDINYTTQNYKTAYLSFKTNFTLYGQIIGLYSGSGDVDYGFLFHTNGNVYITESGSANNGIIYNADDFYTVEVLNNRVIYYRNLNIWYINEFASTNSNYIGYFSLGRINDIISDISFGYLPPSVLPLTASFAGTVLNTGTTPFSSTYSTSLTETANLNDASFTGTYTGNDASSFTVTITQLVSYIPLVESTVIPFQVGEVIQGEQNSVTASIVCILPIGSGGSALGTDGQVDFTGNSRIIGLSSGAIAAYDSLRAADLFTWHQTGGSGLNGTSITNISFVTDTVLLSDGISVTFPNATGHSLNDQWIYSINQVFNNPLTVNSHTDEILKINSDGDVIINSVPYQFPTVQGASNSILTNNGAGDLSWIIPTASQPEYARISLLTTGVSASHAFDLFINDSNQIGISGSNVLLNQGNTFGKIYLISVTFYIYNVGNEPCSYRFKLNGSNYSIDANLGQHNTLDFTFTPVTLTDMLILNSSANLEFWRTSSNTVDPATNGIITIVEISK